MMATERERMLMQSYKAFTKKPTISMDELDDLMYQVEKVLQNIRCAEESRDKYKAKLKYLEKSIGGVKNGNKI